MLIKTGKYAFFCSVMLFNAESTRASDSVKSQVVTVLNKQAVKTATNSLQIYHLYHITVLQAFLSHSSVHRTHSSIFTTFLLIHPNIQSSKINAKSNLTCCELVNFFLSMLFSPFKHL